MRKTEGNHKQITGVGAEKIKLLIDPCTVLQKLYGTGVVQVSSVCVS